VDEDAMVAALGSGICGMRALMCSGGAAAAGIG